MTRVRDALPIHGGQLRATAEAFSIPIEELTDFSASIHPDGPPASVVVALRQALDGPATLTAYPDLQSTDLKQAISRHVGIPRESICVANGFVPLLQAALHAKKIRSCLLPVPAFGEYRHSLEQAGIAVTLYPLEPAGFRYDPAALLAAGASHDAILLANPQNPSGALCPRVAMLALIQGAAAGGITVLLDEAFIDYIPAESLICDAWTQPNLVLFRSVTKFFAMPGLRVAYSVSSPGHADEIARSVPPWPVGTLASLAVSAALDDHEYARQARQGNSARRASMQKALELLGVTVYPAAANFLLLGLPSRWNARSVREHLIREAHLVVRACESFEGLSANHLRVAVRSERENTQLACALKNALDAAG